MESATGKGFEACPSLLPADTILTFHFSHIPPAKSETKTGLLRTILLHHNNIKKKSGAELATKNLASQMSGKLPLACPERACFLLEGGGKKGLSRDPGGILLDGMLIVVRAGDSIGARGAEST